MPITQDKMLETLTAAQSAMDKLEELKGVITQYCGMVNQGLAKEQDLVRYLLSVVDTYHVDPKLVGFVDAELRYYKRTYNENKRQRDKAQRKRAFKHLDLTPIPLIPTAEPTTRPRLTGIALYDHIAREVNKPDEPTSLQIPQKSTLGTPDIMVERDWTQKAEEPLVLTNEDLF